MQHTSLHGLRLARRTQRTEAGVVDWHLVQAVNHPNAVVEAREDRGGYEVASNCAYNSRPRCSGLRLHFRNESREARELT